VNDTVLIVGVSVRSVAESASRAGYAVSAVDGFGDLDLRAVATEVIRVTPYTAIAAARAAQHVRAAAVCYVSNFENHPSALHEVARCGATRPTSSIAHVTLWHSSTPRRRPDWQRRASDVVLQPHQPPFGVDG
jgi:hypothetical protein